MQTQHSRQGAYKALILLQKKKKASLMPLGSHSPITVPTVD